MRVDFNFFSIFCIIKLSFVETCLKQEHCLLSELEKPDHFDKWDCSEAETQE